MKSDISEIVRCWIKDYEEDQITAAVNLVKSLFHVSRVKERV